MNRSKEYRIMHQDINKQSFINKLRYTDFLILERWLCICIYGWISWHRYIFECKCTYL